MTAMGSPGVAAAGGRLLPLLSVPAGFTRARSVQHGSQLQLHHASWEAESRPASTSPFAIVPQEEQCASKLGLFWTRNSINVDKLQQPWPTAVSTP